MMAIGVLLMVLAFPIGYGVKIGGTRESIAGYFLAIGGLLCFASLLQFLWRVFP